MANAPEAEQNRSTSKPLPPGEAVPMGADGDYTPPLEVLQDTLRRAKARRWTITKWKPGRTTFRLLPPYKEGGGFYEWYYWHWNVGPERKGMMCRFAFGEPCYLCEQWEELMASDDPRDQEEVERLRVTTRYFGNVIVIGEEDEGVQVVEFKERQARVLIELALDPEIGNFTDSKTGRNLTIEKTGSGLQTRYSDPRIAANPSPIPYPDWMQRIKHLDQLFPRPSRRNQQERFEGLEGGEFN
jgi:gp32-like DNA binding protein